VTSHLERDPLAGPREANAAIGRVVREPEPGDLLYHRGRRRCADVQPTCERARGHTRGLLLELVDLAQIILGGVGDPLRRALSPWSALARGAHLLIRPIVR